MTVANVPLPLSCPIFSFKLRLWALAMKTNIVRRGFVNSESRRAFDGK